MLTDSTRARDFPSLTGIAYLNSAAESIPPLCVGEALQDYWRDKTRGMRGRDAHFAAVQACREISAKMLGLLPQEVSFCSCSSEAYNLLASALQPGSDDEVVLTDLDFPAGVTPWLRAAAPPRARLWASVHGELDAADLMPLLNAQTFWVRIRFPRQCAIEGSRVPLKPIDPNTSRKVDWLQGPIVPIDLDRSR